MPYHASAAGSELHIFAQVTSSDPGAIGAGKGWIDTSSGPPYQLKIRNSGDSGWENVGVVGTFATAADLTAHEADTANPHSVTASQAGAEPALGNPGVNGQVLASTTAGTRSWVTLPTQVVNIDDLLDVDLTTPPTDGQALVWNDGDSVWEAGTVSGGGGSGHTIEDEGTPLTARAALNFVGAGVAVTDDAGNDATVVTISGGGATALDDLSDVDLTTNAPTSGDVLTFDGTDWVPEAPTGGAAAAPTTVFRPRHNEPPASAYATLDTRNSRPVLDFDAAAVEAAVFSNVVPDGYDAGNITVYLHTSYTSATSGDVIWRVSFERVGDEVLDTDSDSFDTGKTATVTAPATSGYVSIDSITFTQAEADDIAPGELYRVKVERVATDGGDTATGDAELHAVEVRW